MAGRGIDYWQKQWDEALTDEISLEHGQSQKMAALFQEYTSYMHFIPGPICRFFSGRWNTHHAKEVEKAIGSKILLPITCLVSPEDMLISIRNEMGNKPYSEEGDFAQILAVIEKNTGLSYQTLEASSKKECQMT